MAPSPDSQLAASKRPSHGAMMGYAPPPGALASPQVSFHRGASFHNNSGRYRNHLTDEEISPQTLGTEHSPQYLEAINSYGRTSPGHNISGPGYSLTRSSSARHHHRPPRQNSNHHRFSSRLPSPSRSQKSMVHVVAKARRQSMPARSTGIVVDYPDLRLDF
jgi:hypothetical protein